jgi:soluble lytic murein transglycosylase-like protein
MTRALMIASILLAMAGSVQADELSRSPRMKQRQISTAKRAAIYEPHILRAAARYRVDPRILWTIAYLESGFNPRAVSHKGARGLMQFMPATARRYGLKNPHDPLSSIDAAARYVRDISRRFGGRRDLVLAAYNAGEHAVIRAGHNVPRYRETRQYVARGVLLMDRLNRPIQQTEIVKAAETEPLIKPDPSRQSIYVAHGQEPRLRLQARSRASVTRSLYFNDR